MMQEESLPPGISIVTADNFEEWQMDIRVLDDNPLYKGQTYRLKFTFSSKYPIGLVYPSLSSSFTRLYNRFDFANSTIGIAEPPEVQFIECPETREHARIHIPMHPHVYSNGIICLDLLGYAGWAPFQTVEGVCLSLQSMLTANNRNERPPGDAEFVSFNRKRPRDINFQYEDDNV